MISELTWDFAGFWRKRVLDTIWIERLERERESFCFVCRRRKKAWSKSFFVEFIICFLLIWVSALHIYFTSIITLSYSLFFLFKKKKLRQVQLLNPKCSWGAEDMVRRGCSAHKGTVFMTARSAVCVLVCAQAYVIFLLAVRVWACNCNRTR